MKKINATEQLADVCAVCGKRTADGETVTDGSHAKWFECRACWNAEEARG